MSKYYISEEELKEIYNSQFNKDWWAKLRGSFEDWLEIKNERW